MEVVVAGGTGLLGREITRALLGAGHQVTVASRSKPEKDPIDSRARWVRGDVTEPGGLVEALAGAGAVVDAVQFPNSPMENPRKGFTFERIDLQGTRNLVDAARTAGVGYFIGLSGVGAAEGAEYPWLRYKWQEEQHIIASGLPYTIFRPSWIYGERDVALNRFLGFAKFLPFVPVVGDGKTRINPLYVGDLGAHVAATLGNDAAKDGIFELGGPDIMTMDDVIRTALRVAGKRRFLLHSPRPLMKLAAGVIQFAPGRPLTPGGVDFITMDGVADTSALTATFGLPLTPLEQGLAAYLTKS
ncbi:MAG: NAD(P)H-binding protein [Dehalococcoidia bacterium]|nr:NAD(P)H-binding protein [Dehalococcoidia bacterium]